jgi:hypothetical protein
MRYLTAGLQWLQGMPDWFKASLLGAAIVLGTIFLLVRMVRADDINCGERLAVLETQVAADRQVDSHLQVQLDRIEEKLDRLILELVGD